jgi:hypothetical protein
MPWVIVNNETLEIATTYSSDPDVQLDYHGDWGNPELFTHVKVPDGYKSNLTLAQRDSDGVIQIVENPNDNKNEIALQTFRALRNSKLVVCDWTQARDSPLTIEKQDEWAAYRQALRDLPSTVTDPTNVTWPAPPS